jgi:hypothetical protein
MNQAGIKPHVAVSADGRSAQITEGQWALPPLYGTYGSYKPLYRAELAAGVLYRLSRLPDYSADRFIVDTDGTNCTIFYDDQPVLVITPEDASANAMSVMDLTGLYVLRLKEWQAR